MTSQHDFLNSYWRCGNRVQHKFWALGPVSTVVTLQALQQPFMVVIYLAVEQKDPQWKRKRLELKLACILGLFLPEEIQCIIVLPMPLRMTC